MSPEKKREEKPKIAQFTAEETWKGAKVDKAVVRMAENPPPPRKDSKEQKKP